MSQPPSDRRSAFRHTAHMAAVIEVDGTVVDCGVSRDASANGLRLMTRTDLTAGTVIDLLLYVIEGSSPRRLRGIVAHSEKLPIKEQDVWIYCLGISILDPPTDLEAIVEKISRGPATGRPPP
jgi:hypothetical protein